LWLLLGSGSTDDPDRRGNGRKIDRFPSKSGSTPEVFASGLFAQLRHHFGSGGAPLHAVAPPRSSWLNQVETWFFILQGQSLNGASLATSNGL
jgi:hypothetical protein